MNLIEITEQLKNPAVSVQQLMQYANNSNPQVPSYVALAEMQRRQSMQAPAQAPQQTVKEQLGASLMGLPAAASQAPGAAPAPQQPMQQPMPQQEVQVPMPAPKPSLPAQPGTEQPAMAGGGLTSIPLNMHHDFASGGIIAFASGGEPDPYALKAPITEEEAKEKLIRAEKEYGFGGDPYAEAKRRYADIEAKQKEREQNAGSDRFWAGLAAYGSAGPKGFAQAAGNASKAMQSMEQQQQAQSEANATKMAELHSLWGKEQEAMNRARYAAVTGKVKEEQAALQEVAKLRQTRDQVEAQKTSAAASARQAETLAGKEAFDQKNYPEELKIKKDQVRAQLIAAGKNPGEVQLAYGILADMKKTNPDATLLDAMTAMQSGKVAGKGALTQDQMLDAWEKMKFDERMERKKRAGGDLLKAQQNYFNEIRGGLASLPTSSSTGGRNPSDMSNEELLRALGRK